MRIIAGTHVRTKLIPPKGMETRPISDRVKEALFSIIHFRLAGSRVADLFCGTGSMGLESISRGAEHALMIDQSTDALDRMKKNIAHCGFEEKTSVVRADLFRLRTLPQTLSSCNFIFVDPPYRLIRETELTSKLGRLLLAIEAQISSGAQVIVRHEKKTKLLENYSTLTVTDRRQYGGMAITFLEKADASQTA